MVEKRYKRRKIECRQREIREKERRKDKYRLKTQSLRGGEDSERGD